MERCLSILRKELSVPMTRAAREPADDVVRRIATACRAANLDAVKRHNLLMRERRIRFILVGAAPKGWSHNVPMLEVHTDMDLAGNVGTIRIRCSATKDDPARDVWVAPTLRDAEVSLDELPHTLRMICRERDEVIRLIAEGRQPPFAGLHWTWLIPEWPLGNPSPL
jgi:hypothetical protein